MDAEELGGVGCCCQSCLSSVKQITRGICIGDESEEQQPPVVFVPVCFWFQRERIRLRAWAPVGFHRSGG